jgi:hypothetical protein
VERQKKQESVEFMINDRSTFLMSGIYTELIGKCRKIGIGCTVIIILIIIIIIHAVIILR